MRNKMIITKLPKNGKILIRLLSMEVEAGLAPFVVYKDCLSCFWMRTLGIFNQSGLKKLISGNFYEKGSILKNLAKI